MALAFKVSDLNVVPEALRSAYIQKDGSFVLDVEGVVAATEVEGLKKNRDDLKAEKQKAITDYQALLENSRLSDEDRTNLKARVDELESQVLTKEEIAAKAVKKARDEAAGEIEKIKGQAKHYESMFTTSTIRSEILKAAQELGARDPGDIFDIFERKSDLEPTTDDEGKQTGYQSMTTVSFMDGEKLVEKRLPTREAIKVFLADPRKSHHIDSKFRAGGGATGGHPSQGGDKNLTSTQMIEAGLRQQGRA